MTPRGRRGRGFLPGEPMRNNNGSRCWLCGHNAHRTRSDVMLAGAHICDPCWTAQPRGWNSWVRAAAALAIALNLGRRTWVDNGFRHGWVQEVAHRHGIGAWHDVDRRTTDPPEHPFGWIPAATLEAARQDLERLEADFEASRRPPHQRRREKRPHG